jgi:hypothetical protein
MGLRIDEELEGPAPVGALQLADLLGTWVNADQQVTGRALRMEVSEDDGRLRMRGFGSGDTEPQDWGEVEATALAKTPGERRASGHELRGRQRARPVLHPNLLLPAMSAAVGGAPRTELEFKLSDQARSAVDRVGVILRDLTVYLRHDNDDRILATIGRAPLGQLHDPSHYRP